MKIFISLFCFLVCLSAHAGSFTAVEADHANLLYSEGEKAHLVLRLLSIPTAGDYDIVVSVEQLGVAGPANIDFHHGMGVFNSAALEAGTQELTVVTKITGPDSFEETVQIDHLNLEVKPYGILEKK